MNSNWVSTRGSDEAAIDESIMQGLAPDGGLFVPSEFPRCVINDFYHYTQLSEFALNLLRVFFKQSAVSFNSAFCEEVFSFPLPLHQLTENKYVLELFHGPTLSFKDFGARFFAQCLGQLAADEPIKVLVATSGDTGSAVASALHGKKGVDGFVLFPKDKISMRQQMQITTWGDNIHALAVNGSFDDCQRLIKSALKQTIPHARLTTANSINSARLLPQMLFYAYSSIQVMKSHKQPANFIVPSGNLGNVTACYWAKTLGFPIDAILIANNANHVLSDLLETGSYHPQPSVKTLANAMDVGDPSNLERLVHLFGGYSQLRASLDVCSVSDHEIKQAIINCYKTHNYLICPHTATAYHRMSLIQSSNKPWVIMATAHPVKFNEIIESLLNVVVPIPESLAVIMKRKQHYQVIDSNKESFFL
jgi:threonine synthase